MPRAVVLVAPTVTELLRSHSRVTTCYVEALGGVSAELSFVRTLRRADGARSGGPELGLSPRLRNGEHPRPRTGVLSEA